MSYKRIISLVPSLTELIIDFGLGGQLIGRTRFCVHPAEKVKTIPIIGGTKNPNIEKIIALKPDLIIANKEENTKKEVEELSKHVEVVVTEIDSVEEAIEWVQKLGVKLGVEEAADQLITSVERLTSMTNDFHPISTAYFIWRQPWMTIGNDTYIHDIMNHFGLINIFGDQTRYPETNLSELASLSPELVLLSSEPYPFKKKHFQEIRINCPNSRILLVDGEWFSWYGSRMIPAFEGLLEWRSDILS